MKIHLARIKNSHLLILLVLFYISLMSGCASNGVYTSSGNKITDVQTAFKNGDIRLNCGVGCSFKEGTEQAKQKEFFNNGLWYDLVNLISSFFSLSGSTIASSTKNPKYLSSGTNFILFIIVETFGIRSRYMTTQRYLLSSPMQFRSC